MPLVDTIFQPLLDASVGCLCVAMITHPSPPALCCQRWGDHVSLGVSTTQDECCSGLAWVRFDSAVTTDDGSFPRASTLLRKCSQQWSVSLELGVARCAPIGDAHTLPTCGDWTDLKALAAADMLALRQTVCCIQEIFGYRDLVVGSFQPKGPEGGCYRTTLDVTVKLTGCDECD